MSRIVLAFILTFTAAGAGAVNWPWQDPAPEEPLPYCKGFVVGGLASKAASGNTRTDLWLAWNYVIHAAPLEESVSSEEFQAGRQQFQQVADATAAAELVQNTDGNCGLGRSGHEITGW
ncbi:MAG: hypothetical protein KDI17_06435 [Halioglobus sp.]|nr:hypothetical protein [Halioglobus sp.]